MYWSASPFIVPVAVFAMVLGIVIVVNIYNYQVRKLKSEERLAAIAKGIPLPPDVEAEFPVSADRGAATARGLRTGGIACISVGVGLALFSFFLTWIVQEHDVLAVAAAGLIPLAVGVGLLVDYALRTRTAKAEGN
jgi:hydrogenase-4 membrane subunit HyfE